MKLKTQQNVPTLELDLVNDTRWSLQEQTPKNFTLLVFYRGLHCPVCKRYLQKLQDRIEAFTARGINLIAISSDSEKKAKTAYREWEVKDLPIGYEYPIEEARKWGLYISKGIKEEEPEIFIEPGLFLIRPDETLYSASIQSMPFARPEFENLLKGIDYVLEHDYPARGEA
ncbi:redoxin domain-containing protein [Flavobacteriaceae bacterium TP-CH-4]|uniref:Redoxin domain-containing protein n=1 Tax=Pelagihabitans pacificus TaxID=2696054 RepID=A0A967EDB5_9FLAO|nr:redoxin domain-containing protein [Pelagihabitans pacificus]NHF59163.1 redoxin domain-containing protein [Pelagihabitans pacificus]